MSDPETRARPLDRSLKARLHLPITSRFRIGVVRAVMNAVDGLWRATGHQPFFALRESEAFLSRMEGVRGPELIRAVLQERGGTEILPHGLENVPKTGPVIIASTHPTGLFDMVAHGSTLLAWRPDLKVVANRETELFLGPDLIVPVVIDPKNRAVSGTETRTGMRRHLDSGGALLIFGSGRVPNQREGWLVEPAWKHGATQMSEECAAPLVPAAIAVRNSPAYYRARRLGEILSGGDDNVGALFGSLRYAEELLRKLGGRYEVFYGDPLPPGTSAEAAKRAAEGLVPGLYALPG